MQIYKHNVFNNYHNKINTTLNKETILFVNHYKLFRITSLCGDFFFFILFDWEKIILNSLINNT